ncbi:hypothetical protein [Helicobacter sp. T3_23-1056]
MSALFVSVCLASHHSTQHKSAQMRSLTQGLTQFTQFTRIMQAKQIYKNY